MTATIHMYMHTHTLTHTHTPVGVLCLIKGNQSKDVVEMRRHTAGVKGQTRLVGVLRILSVEEYDDNYVVA